MKMRILNIDCAQNGRCAVDIQAGEDVRTSIVTVNFEDGSHSIEGMESWLRSFLWIGNVQRAFADAFFAACRENPPAFPIDIEVAKFADLGAVIRELIAGVPPSVVQKRYRRDEGE